MPAHAPTIHSLTKRSASPGGGRITYRGPGGTLYLNLTNRCSASCVFCLRQWSDGVYGQDLILDAEPGLEDVTKAIELEFMDAPADEVVFCGFGEPTLRLDVLLGTCEWLHLRRIRSRLDTNGHGNLLNPSVDVPGALAAAGLSAVTVSINAADPSSYEKLCRPIFAKAHKAVIAFATACVQLGIETTLSVVDHPDADRDDCAAMARAIGAGFRVRSLVSPSPAIPEDST